MSTNSSIAITGATGFIGNILINTLSQAGWHVHALYRPKKGRIQKSIPGVKWVPGDLNDSNALNTLLDGVNTVIHCAGVVRGASQADFDIVNEQGTLKIAKAAEKQKNSPRFLLISSLAAREPELSHYSGSKWRGERILHDLFDTLKWSIIRPPAVYGPGDKELLPLFQSISRGFAPTPAGNDNKFSMIYVDDLVLAIKLWLEADTGYGETFELDDGKKDGYDWKTIIEIGSEVLYNKNTVRRIEIPTRLFKFIACINLFFAKTIGYSPMLTPGKVREITHSNWVSDNEKISSILGFKPTTKLDIGLSNIFNSRSLNK